MNAAKPTIQSRYAFYAAAPQRRSPIALFPHAIAFMAAFCFISAVVIGAL
ncbi:hypothetical protein LPJGGPFB_06334 [Ensifer adhaerens]|uniref:Uncharacterized protein n=1 Tax=Ensifer adhaerens TaxID=106592 RepID=A0ACC5SZR4_ENSAD|nr:hypothetical protein [Ensifer adhaerens]MBP1874366.1 hypothetical protein [Ensifer adhaerens]NRP23065.1 hypothetical protein [Ensifer adhaerens]